jgi:hypothetical protein
VIDLSPQRLAENATFFAIRHERSNALADRLFTTLAGVAVNGRPLTREAARAACCTGPNGSDYCGSSFCTGAGCGGANTCQYVTGFCFGDTSPCWTSSCGGCTCCDCLCTEPPPFNGQFYCYCTDC